MMWAVKLCSNKILQCRCRLTQVVLYNGRKTVAVVVVVVVAVESISVNKKINTVNNTIQYNK